MDLLQTYSIEQILTFIVALALAIKGCISFLDWAFAKVKQFVETKEEPEKLKNRIESHAQEIEDLKQIIKGLYRKIDILIESDRAAIKAYITKEHHFFCYEQKWIDDYNLACIEKRYSHYKEQGGNSFAATLMEDLRALPKQSPELVKAKDGASEEV